MSVNAAIRTANGDCYATGLPMYVYAMDDDYVVLGYEFMMARQFSTVYVALPWLVSEAA